MSNEGLDEVRVQAGNVPDIDSAICTTSHIFVTGGETAAPEVTGGPEFGDNHSGIRVSGCSNSFPPRDKSCPIRGESNVVTFISGSGLTAIGVPPPYSMVTGRRHQELGI